MRGRIATAAVVFGATWLMWSGMMKPLLLGLGLVSVLLVLVLAYRIRFFAPAMYTLHMLGRLPRFWLYLMPEIVKANLAVARVILSRRLPISPCIITIDASSLPRTARVALANAITLTPGTLTLNVQLGQIRVHCLTEEAARDLDTVELMQRARALRGG